MLESSEKRPVRSEAKRNEARPGTSEKSYGNRRKKTMTTRRKLIFGTAVFLAAGSWAGVASAASDELLADLLYGVTDALTREYIREHYREGRWDGHRWYYDGRWYSRDAYRRFLAERAAASRTPSGRTGRSRLRSPISPSTRFFRHASRRPIPAIRFGTSSTPFNRPRQPAAGFPSESFSKLFRGFSTLRTTP